MKHFKLIKYLIPFLQVTLLISDRVENKTSNATHLTETSLDVSKTISNFSRNSPQVSIHGIENVPIEAIEDIENVTEFKNNLKFEDDFSPLIGGKTSDPSTVFCMFVPHSCSKCAELEREWMEAAKHFSCNSQTSFYKVTCDARKSLNSLETDHYCKQAINEESPQIALYLLGKSPFGLYNKVMPLPQSKSVGNGNSFITLLLSHPISGSLLSPCDDLQRMGNLNQIEINKMGALVTNTSKKDSNDLINEKPLNRSLINFFFLQDEEESNINCEENSNRLRSPYLVSKTSAIKFGLDSKQVEIFSKKPRSCFSDSQLINVLIGLRAILRWVSKAGRTEQHITAKHYTIVGKFLKKSAQLLPGKKHPRLCEDSFNSGRHDVSSEKSNVWSFSGPDRIGTERIMFKSQHKQ